MRRDEKPPSPGEQSETKKESNHALSAPKISNRQCVAGQILIKFKDGTNVASMRSIQRAFHLEPVKVVTEPNLYLMRILDGTPVEQLIQTLKEIEDVEYAEPNTLYSLD